MADNCEKCKYISYHGWQTFCKKMKYRTISNIEKRPKWCPNKTSKIKVKND